jgi:multiple antibiotic resistance protein
MSDAIHVFLVTLSALFPIVNPLSGSPIFLALTIECTPALRRRLARRVAFNSLFLMIGSYFFGSYVLSFFGVSLPVVQAAGGLVVAGMGWKLLMAKDDARDAAGGTIQPEEAFRRAFYPLALPLTVGPGSITVAVTLGAHMVRHNGLNVVVIVAALLGIGLVGLSVFFCYGFADKLEDVLGETGTTVFIRLASFLLLCIGVQIVWNGVKALMETAVLHVQ